MHPILLRKFFVENRAPGEASFPKRAGMQKNLCCTLFCLDSFWRIPWTLLLATWSMLVFSGFSTSSWGQQYLGSSYFRRSASAGTSHPQQPVLENPPFFFNQVDCDHALLGCCCADRNLSKQLAQRMHCQIAPNSSLVVAHQKFTIATPIFKVIFY